MLPGLLDTVLSGPAAFPYKVAWGLLVLGTIVSASLENLAVARGEAPKQVSVFMRSASAAVLLACYTFVMKAIWWSFAGIANQVFTQQQGANFGKILSGAVTQFTQVTTPGTMISGIWNGVGSMAVSVTGIMASVAATMSRWQLTTLQICLYNVVFAIGPLLIALSAFGLKTLKIWISAALEIASWSLTAAVLWATMYQTTLRYWEDVAGKSLVGDTRWLDVIDNYVLLASMCFVVPIVSARFFGFSALGELAAAQVHTMAGNLGNRVRGWMPGSKDQSSPSMDTSHPQATPSNPISSTRPGD